MESKWNYKWQLAFVSIDYQLRLHFSVTSPVQWLLLVGGLFASILFQIGNSMLLFSELEVKH